MHQSSNYVPLCSRNEHFTDSHLHLHAKNHTSCFVVSPIPLLFVKLMEQHSTIRRKCLHLNFPPKTPHVLALFGSNTDSPSCLDLLSKEVVVAPWDEKQGFPKLHLVKKSNFEPIQMVAKNVTNKLFYGGNTEKRLSKVAPMKLPGNFRFLLIISKTYLISTVFGYPSGSILS